MTAKPLDHDTAQETAQDTARDTAHATGPGTVPRNDVADPHPADEERPYRKPVPAAKPESDLNRVNPAAHDGTAPPPPANAENSR